ncbi:hypothetical protein LIER_34795 [Lithospermum erythrorhizon]|uniref:Pentatricopeptide repeat-containing protein n=1 Tax=Lithospermum erythrorhizon TaxID=34254 RepID=A0AAV3S1V2_LITER
MYMFPPSKIQRTLTIRPLLNPISTPFSSSSSSTNLSNLITAILNSKNSDQALYLFNTAPKNFKLDPKNNLKLHSAVVYFLTGSKLYLTARCLIKDLTETLQKTKKPHKVCSLIYDSLNELDCYKRDYNVFGVLIIALCELGLVDEAYRVYKRMGTLPQIQACNKLLDVLLRKGRVGFMWDVYEDMVSRGAVSTVVTYGVLIDACCIEGDMERAVILFDEMLMDKEIALLVVVCTTMVRGFCGEGKLVEAERLFRRMAEIGVSLNLHCYNTLMGGYCKIADVRRVIFLYREMIDRGILPNVFTFSILIDVHCKAGELVAARNLFVPMVKYGAVPNSCVYNCLIDGYCLAGDLLAANEIHSEMKRVSIPSDVFTYGILMKGYCRLGRVEETESLLREMSETGVIANVVVYDTIINGYCKEGKMEKALEICTQMTEKGIQPNAVTFGTLIDGYCKVGNMEASMGLFNEMAIKGLKADVVVYTTLIDGHFKVGKSEVALKLFKEMIEAGICPNSFTSSSMVDGLCKDGRLNDAIVFLNKTGVGTSGEAAIKTNANNFHANVVVYTALIQGLCKDGRILKASKFFLDMRRNGLKPDEYTYSILIEGHFIAERVCSLMMLHADMLKMGIKLNDALCKLLGMAYNNIK